MWRPQPLPSAALLRSGLATAFRPGSAPPIHPLTGNRSPIHPLAGERLPHPLALARSFAGLRAAVTCRPRILLTEMCILCGAVDSRDTNVSNVYVMFPAWGG